MVDRFILESLIKEVSRNDELQEKAGSIERELQLERKIKIVFDADSDEEGFYLEEEQARAVIFNINNAREKIYSDLSKVKIMVDIDG